MIILIRQTVFKHFGTQSVYHYYYHIFTGNFLSSETSYPFYVDYLNPIFFRAPPIFAH